MRGGGNLLSSCSKAFTLAEGTTCEATLEDNRFSAFTLAEVLVTLGIIGVVAAMTMPVLIGKYQHFVLVNRAKKAYSILYQAYYKTLADLEFSNTCFYDAAGAGTQPGSSSYSDCTVFREQLLKNLKVIKYCQKGYEEGCIISYKGKDDVIKEQYENSDISQDELDEKIDFSNKSCGFTTAGIKNYRAIVLADGFTIISVNPAYFAIDTNGAKGPNKWGYDLFILYVYYKDMKKLHISGKEGCTFIEKGGMFFDKMLLE